MKKETPSTPKPFPEKPVEPLAEDGFGARPEQIAPLLESSKAQFGEQSPEYGTALMRWADAHMAQGSQSHPQALEGYGKALGIFKGWNPESPQTAWALDRVSAAKQASGDAAGAATALADALKIWNQLAADGNEAVDDFYRGRRQEDLDRLRLFVERTPMTRDSATHVDRADAARNDETLEEMLARKTELEGMAQAFAVAGMEMPAGSEEEYLRLKERIWRRSTNPEPTGKAEGSSRLPDGSGPDA